jgi:nitrate reductase (cytochrome), electron transfer subunit
MRSQDPVRLRLALVVAGMAAALGFFGVAAAQDLNAVPELTGPVEPMQPIPAAPIPRWVVDDVRLMRQYPEQPPVIPHSIEGYELSVNANRCLSCHRREATEGSGAPMISVTHYMTRDAQMLADVSPRRYFCTACHVVQADTAPLVGNTFTDMADMGVTPSGAE